MKKDLEERIREHNSRIINENIAMKAEPTYGMNTYQGMDLVIQQEEKTPLQAKQPGTSNQRPDTKFQQPGTSDKQSGITDQQSAPTASRIQQVKEEAAKESMAQLDDRIESNSFQ